MPVLVRLQRLFEAGALTGAFLWQSPGTFWQGPKTVTTLAFRTFIGHRKNVPSVQICA